MYEPTLKIVNKQFNYLFNESFRLKNIPTCWKVAEIIIFPRYRKLVIQLTSYRPIFYSQWYRKFIKTHAIEL